jgi:hypothetical protein
LRSHVARYGWQKQITRYDNLFTGML